MRSRAKWSLLVTVSVLMAGLAVAAPTCAVEVANVWLEFDPSPAYVDETVTCTLRYELDPALAEELEDANELVDYEVNWDFDGGTCVSPPADWHTEDAVWDTVGVKEVVLSGWVVVGFPDGSTLRLTGTARGEVTIVADLSSAELVACGFGSDHGVLRDNNTTWSDEGDLFPEPEWDPDEGRNCPISHTAGEYIEMTVKVTVPEGLNCNLYAEGPGYFTGVSESFTSTGEEQTVSITMSTPLPNTVGVLSGSMDWSVCDGENDEFLGTTGPHKIYLTLDDPIGGIMTEKRLAWVCAAANGATTATGAADGVWQALSGDPPHDSPDGGRTRADGWILLDPNSNKYGQCNDQADLMGRGMNLLGVNYIISLVRASSDAGEGSCRDQEKRTVNGNIQWLVLYFGPQANAFEGCCVTPLMWEAEQPLYYAVMPSHRAAHDYDMLKTLGLSGVEQYWVRTNNNAEPGQPGCYPIQEVYGGPVPIP